MGRLWTALLGTLLLAVLPAVAQDTPVLVGRVTQVTDGDTLKVQLSSWPITVRLGQIDAPESDQPYGRKAAAALRTLAGGRTVALEEIEPGSLRAAGSGRLCGRNQRE